MNKIHKFPIFQVPRAPLELSFGLSVLIFDRESDFGHENSQKDNFLQISRISGPPGSPGALLRHVGTDFQHRVRFLPAHERSQKDSIS